MRTVIGIASAFDFSAADLADEALFFSDKMLAIHPINFNRLTLIGRSIYNKASWDLKIFKSVDGENGPRSWKGKHRSGQ